MTERHDQGIRYRAFISYSHKDSRAARWLHRRIEGYRIPRRLVGRPGAHGPVPARLVPIFRDRDELPAAGNLSETVQAALAASGSLIVLCSPDSAASPWVAREIDTFRQIHPDRPVFAAILSGEPSECFPAALRGSDTQFEPIAADLRRGGDGRRLGLLKLIAGIVGLGLDPLVQRDNQRRLRRVTAITVAALAGMLVLALVTFSAITARAEAERQRAEAEGLVEFMLTDLRDSLRKVGRLDAMTAVNARALEYCRRQSNHSSLPDESAIRCARVVQVIGDDRLVADDPHGALEAFDTARQTTQKHASGRAPHFLLVHSKSLMGTGRAYEELHDWPRAQLNFAAAAEAADRLAASEPGNADHLMKVAAAAVNLGNVQFYGAKDVAAAQRSYERALAVLARALRARPGDEHILLSQANAYAYLADSFYERALWTRSRDARLKQHAIVEPLSRADPDNLDVMFRLAAARRGLALSLLKCGDAGGARARLDQARAAAVFLTRREPQNHGWMALRARLEQDGAEFGKGQSS